MVRIKPMKLEELKTQLTSLIKTSKEAYSSYLQDKIRNDPIRTALSYSGYGGIDPCDKVCDSAVEWLKVLEFVELCPISLSVTEVPEKYLHVLAEFNKGEKS